MEPSSLNDRRSPSTAASANIDSAKPRELPRLAVARYPDPPLALAPARLAGWHRAETCRASPCLPKPCPFAPVAGWPWCRRAEAHRKYTVRIDLAHGTAL